MPVTVTRRTVRWNIGPDELPCKIAVNVYPPEPASWSEWDGGSPGYPADAEIVDVTVIDNGIRRGPTAEEEIWIDADRDEIEEKALHGDY